MSGTAIDKVRNSYPPNTAFVGLFGSVNHDFHTPITIANETNLLHALSYYFAYDHLPDDVEIVFLTGGNPIFGLNAAKSILDKCDATCSPPPTFYHLVPSDHPHLKAEILATRALGMSEIWMDGVGVDMADRRRILVEHSDVAIACGGGAGTGTEIDLSLEARVAIYPLACTGGVAETHAHRPSESELLLPSTTLITFEEAMRMVSIIMTKAVEHARAQMAIHRVVEEME